MNVLINRFRNLVDLELVLSTRREHPQSRKGHFAPNLPIPADITPKRWVDDDHDEDVT